MQNGNLFRLERGSETESNSLCYQRVLECLASLQVCVELEPSDTSFDITMFNSNQGESEKSKKITGFKARMIQL